MIESTISTFVFYAFPTAVFLYGIRKYRESKWGKCKNMVRMDGKLIIITGANSGIGFETAKDLAHRGANIIFACRNEASAKEAIQAIKTELKIENKLEYMHLDLSSSSSVRTFVERINSNYDKIDILINNAGISYPNSPRIHLTEDKFEINFGTNYLGPFLLTSLLMDTLQNAVNPRIINVASLLHKKGKLHLDDINYDKTPTKQAYADSKLQLAYFSRELAKRTYGTNIRVYWLCPGWVYTNLFRHSLIWKNILKIVFAMPFAFLFMRNAKQGAQTTIYCATETLIAEESGYMYKDCTKYQSDYDFCDKDGRRLWELSEKLLNL